MVGADDRSWPGSASLASGFQTFSTKTLEMSVKVACRPGAAGRERLLSGALIVLEFGSSVLGTRADPAFPAHHHVSRYGALQATMVSGRVRLATDGGAKIAR